jgi:hypothetical protein
MENMAIQLGCLPYRFTVQPTFLPYFSYLFTIQLGFLPYFAYPITMIWKICKKDKSNSDKILENTEEYCENI